MHTHKHMLAHTHLTKCTHISGTQSKIKQQNLAVSTLLFLITFAMRFQSVNFGLGLTLKVLFLFLMAMQKKSVMESSVPKFGGKQSDVKQKHATF